MIPHLQMNGIVISIISFRHAIAKSAREYDLVTKWELGRKYFKEFQLLIDNSILVRSDNLI